ncbi:protein IL-40 isoform X3 [Rhinolophus sinicus]
MEQEGDSTSEISIAYKVLEVFPKACRVLITCHSPHASLPITYSLWGTGDTEVAKKMVKTQDPASFSINVTLKSRPDLLTYFCQAATTGGKRVVSTKLQMYWELWANPVSQLQANFTLLDEGSGPRVEVACQAFGSPPITYSLIGKNGHVYMQQKPTYGQPANFSFPLTETSEWLQCQAENDISVQSSPLTLVPPEKPTQPRHLRFPHRTAAPGTHLYAGWQPHLYCSYHLLDAGLDQVDQVVTTRCDSSVGPSGTAPVLAPYRRTHHLNEEQACQPGFLEPLCSVTSGWGGGCRGTGRPQDRVASVRPVAPPLCVTIHVGLGRRWG